MNIIDSLDFILKLTFAGFDRATWIWVIVGFLAVFAGLGFLWGRAWNSHWGYSNHFGQTVISLLLALLVAYGVLNWRIARQVERWFEVQRDPIIRSVADSGTFNREVLRKAWDKLQPLGGQKDLTPPSEGGNELRLNNPEEALVLAATAAEEAKGSRSPLRSKAPFIWGSPLTVKDPPLVAAEVAGAIPAPGYPVVVTPSNQWTKSSTTIQAGYALDACRKAILEPMEELRAAAGWLIILATALQFFIIPIAALNDIKANPRV